MSETGLSRAGRVARVLAQALDALVALGPLGLLLLGAPVTSPLGLVCIGWSIVLIAVLALKGGALAQIIPQFLARTPPVVRIAGWVAVAVGITTLGYVLTLNVSLYRGFHRVWIPGEVITVVPRGTPSPGLAVLPPFSLGDKQIFLPFGIDGRVLDVREGLPWNGLYQGVYAQGGDQAPPRNIVMLHITPKLLGPHMADSVFEEVSFWLAPWPTVYSTFFSEFPAGSLGRLSPRFLHTWLVSLALRDLHGSGPLATRSEWQRSESPAGAILLHAANYGRYSRCEVYDDQDYLIFPFIALVGNLSNEYCSLLNSELIAIIDALSAGSGCPFCRLEQDALTPIQRQAFEDSAVIAAGKVSDCSELFRDLREAGEVSLARALDTVDFISMRRDPARRLPLWAKEDVREDSKVHACFCEHFDCESTVPVIPPARRTHTDVSS